MPERRMKMIDLRHYQDIEERRAYYAKKIGSPIVDMYAYYLNMMETAIKDSSTDADANRLKFPHSIRTKQELIKIMMIIQEDTKRDMGIKPPSLENKKFWFKWRKKK
jgi:hypothetical protein